MSKIPGFRTNKTWKKIIALLIYAVVLFTYVYVFYIDYDYNIKNTIILTASLTLFYIPVFFMATNFLGLRNKLFFIKPGQVKLKKFKVFLAVFFSMVLGSVLFLVPSLIDISLTGSQYSDIISNHNTWTINEKMWTMGHSNELLSTEQLAEEKASVILIETNKGTGSGVIINKNGYAITNNHVVAGEGRCSVYFENDQGQWGTNIDATVVYSSNKSDLAIISLDKGNDYPIIPLAGPDSIQEGQQVVAIGSPKGLINTISEGIISGIRKQDGITYLQTSAPVTHGSSGGALLNRKPTGWK